MDDAVEILNLKKSEFAPDYATSVRAIRRQESQLFHRLRSIYADGVWLQHVLRSLPSPPPVIANLRCGLWYLPPEEFTGGRCHFKSTDGHYGKWGFSLSRLNTGVLRVLKTEGRAVIVDSTRKGKEFPDAFARTVPIWALVLNTLFGMSPGTELAHLADSEADQIRRGVEGWVESARKCGVEWDELRLETPIHISFVGRGTASIDPIEAIRSGCEAEGYRLVLVSCSDPRPAGLEREGWQYVQGAGDDHESWAQGLTPAMLWANLEALVGPSQSSYG
eukprot:Hpha_TRINITY_DN36743_c0_g1::TRINITY_DN36743_c0_g1_i1::g.142152::m.142152/K15463/RIT1; tRNA A64-2'-O-ribosylphosphate transferase